MPGVFTIESVDSRCFPRTYQLREISNKKRAFYSFELFKLDKLFDYTNARVEKQQSQLKSRITVQDVLITNTSRLRSGRLLPGREKILYRIERNGEESFLDAKNLDLWKKALGKLEYSSAFDSPEKAVYRI